MQFPFVKSDRKNTRKTKSQLTHQHNQHSHHHHDHHHHERPFVRMVSAGSEWSDSTKQHKGKRSQVSKRRNSDDDNDGECVALMEFV